MKPPPHLRALALALSIATGSACAGLAKSGADGAGTGGGPGCLTSACVGKISTSVTWSIEIDPPSTATGALTELPSVTLGAGPLVLMADSQGTVNATFTAGSGGAVPSSANVVLTYPPLIPGRPDLTVEAAAKAGSSTTVTTAALVTPTGGIGRAATLQLVPLTPADQQSPPTSFAVTVATSLAETLPASYLPIGGTLLSAFMAPPSSTFVARAFAGGTQVSNAPLTAADGTFQLLLAPGASDSVTVELTPQNQDGGDPWYTSSPIDPTMNRNLAPIVLPAYSSPNIFVLAVDGADDPTTPVSGALVRAQAILASSAAGATDFQRAGTTTAKTSSSPGGTVTLSLLPGTATTALDYDLTVIPPASSPYATRCISPVGVTVGGTATAPSSLLTVALSRRPVLAGSVTNAAGYPVANVAITATAGPDPTSGCSSTPAVSSSTIADGNGQFSLPLDPGTYQLDYDPPAGSAAPRLTELAVVVPAGAGSIDHDVTLPMGALVQGTVSAPDGSPLPSATIRIFEVRCNGQDDCFGPTRTPPWLRGQIATDANGTFSVVVPAPSVGN
jgi:hypothetical protein